MSSENIWNDDKELSNALRERHQQQKDRKDRKETLSSSDKKINEDMKREIREKSKNPSQEIMTLFPDDVESELTEHKEK